MAVFQSFPKGWGWFFLMEIIIPNQKEQLYILFPSPEFEGKVLV